MTAPNPARPFVSPTLAALAGASALLLSACSGGGGGGSTAAPTSESLTVTESLESLGVDTTETPRVDHEGGALPEDYSPMGETVPLSVQTELLVIGYPDSSGIDPLTLFDPALPGVETMHSLEGAEVPWATENTPVTGMPQSLRAAVSANVDDDRVQESVIAYVQDGDVHVLVLQDEDDFFVREHHFGPAVPLETYDVAIGAGDFDGDGVDELVIGYSALEGSAEYCLMEQQDGELFVVPGSFTTVEATGANRLLLSFETGQLDYDRGIELLLVANEYATQSSGHPIVATWSVIDSPLEAPTVMQSGGLELLHDSELWTAYTLDGALGDIDGDGLDEVVLAGLNGPDSCSSTDYLLRALDDLAHDLQLMDEVFYEHDLEDCGSDQIHWAHVGTVDLEDDGAREVHVNGLIFEDFRGGAWVQRDELPTWGPIHENGNFTERSSAFAAGDFTGDGREDLAFLGVDRRYMRIAGILEGQTTLTETLIDVPNWDSAADWPRNPILLPVNADNDTTVLEFVDHTYLMTEPVVMAVLAAAPGQEGIGQNVDSCTTTYGNAESSSTGSEFEVSLSVGFIVGADFEQWGNGVDVSAKLSTEYGQTETQTYTVETSIAYETGPLEDTVVFTTVPYDHYTYRVVSDPEPENVGQLVHLSIPRSPMTLQVERGYFNESVSDESFAIDEEILSHEAGDISSYLSASQADSMLQEWPGLKTPTAASCGQGSGSTSLEIAVASEQGSSEFVNFGFEFEASTIVAGVKLGISVGSSIGNTWTRTVGQQTTYSGTVGAIDAANFAEHGFQFGLLTYRQRDEDSGQEFDVINYWVE